MEQISSYNHLVKTPPVEVRKGSAYTYPFLQEAI